MRIRSDGHFWNPPPATSSISRRELTGIHGVARAAPAWRCSTGDLRFAPEIRRSPPMGRPPRLPDRRQPTKPATLFLDRALAPRIELSLAQRLYQRSVRPLSHLCVPSPFSCDLQGRSCDLQGRDDCPASKVRPGDSGQKKSRRKAVPEGLLNSRQVFPKPASETVLIRRTIDGARL